jgi:hypothetical protein
MKKALLLFTITIGIVMILHYSATAQCTARSIIRNCKNVFTDPYRYSGCWMKEFVMDAKWKRIEGRFVAMEGLKYQVLFCSSPSAEKVTINIYDRSAESVKKRKLYDSSKNQSCNLWTFEPEKSGDYYIEYIIPPSCTGKPKSGCIMLMLGTIIETEKDKE